MPSCSPKWLYYQQEVCMNSCCSISSPTHSTWNFANWIDMKWCLLMIILCITLITNIFTDHISFVNCLFYLLGYLFFLLISESSLYVLDINLLSLIHVAIISHQSVTCPFTFFEIDNFNVMNFKNLFLWFFCDLCFLCLV